jgi:parallel beta-helix repeat protein
MTSDPTSSRRGLVKFAFALGVAAPLVAATGCGGDDKSPPSRGRSGPLSTSGKRLSAQTFGAVGDGVTDDTRALTAAVHAVSRAGGGQVLLSGSVAGYVLQTLTLPSGVGLVCLEGHATLLKLGASARWLQSASGATNVTLAGLTLLSRGLVQASVIKVGLKSRGLLVDSCELHGDVARAIGIDCGPGSNDIVIHKTSLDAFSTCVRLNASGENISVDACTMTAWTDRAITVRGTATAAPRGVSLTHNTIGPNAPGGRSRQAIAFSSDHGVPFQDVHVKANHVTGPGIDDKDPSGAGSADLISLHQCRNFEVRDNVVTGSGEVGITVAQGSRDGIVAGNTCTMNDTAGIAIGSSTSAGVRSIVVENNTCADNGQNYGGSAIGDWAYSGITVFEADDITVRQNTLTTTKGKQRFGLSVIGGSQVRVANDNKIRGPVEKGVLRRRSVAGVHGP